MITFVEMRGIYTLKKRLTTVRARSSVTKYHSKTIKIEKNMHVATPLKSDGRIIGAFAMSSTILHDFFIPSVKNLAVHISYAFERAKHIIEQKNAQEMVSQSEQLYRTMIEKAPLGIFTVDTKGVVTALQIGVTQEITRQDENIDLVCSCLFFNSQCIIIQVCPDLYLI